MVNRWMQNPGKLHHIKLLVELGMSYTCLDHLLFVTKLFFLSCQFYPHNNYVPIQCFYCLIYFIWVFLKIKIVYSFVVKIQS